MAEFSPNTDLDDARKLRAFILAATGVLLLTSFGLMSEATLQRKVFYQSDMLSSSSLHQHALTRETPRKFFLALTNLAGQPALMLFTVAVLTVLVFRRHRRLAAIWLAVTFGGFKLVELLKAYYARPRPEFIEPIVQEWSASMPSAHTAGATLVFGLLTYLLIRFTRRLGWILAPLFALLIFAIGFSRVYLGAHWLSDVVGGWLLGSGVVALGMSAAEAWRER